RKMEISQKLAEEEERYKSEMEKIEAAEKKHNREWEEDWGSEDRPKSPRSPKNSPHVPPEMKTTPSPKAKSSLGGASFFTEEEEEDEDDNQAFQKYEDDFDPYSMVLYT
ncbi:hypothetical protein ILYODFUR_011582, partial [Ilyodon furcidens]